MPENLIEARDLTKRYGDKVAVDNVSFNVYGGEVFGFLGPNGAGKTTTLKMIVGLLQPTTGTVHVAGYDIQTQSRQAKASCGYVPDTPNLYAKLTGRELLRFVGDLYDLDRKQATRRADELLRMFDLMNAANDTVDSYSHGMQQKASLAAALMHDPRVLILDEPTWTGPEVGAPDRDILRQLAPGGGRHLTHILKRRAHVTASGSSIAPAHRREPYELCMLDKTGPA
jgi:ABC-2 type transport system ATP-binding protein